VFTAGQPIGLILADSESQARAGARAVLIEYEDLPTILSIEEAIEQNSFFPHYRFIRSGGDMDEAFAAADHVFEGVARMGGQEH
jgi:xanthine dehydrogenase/oxidase